MMRQTDGQRDGRTDARTFHRPCSVYYAGVSNRTLSRKPKTENGTVVAPRIIQLNVKMRFQNIPGILLLFKGNFSNCCAAADKILTSNTQHLSKKM